jgi:hypothetical protein
MLHAGRHAAGHRHQDVSETASAVQSACKHLHTIIICCTHSIWPVVDACVSHVRLPVARIAVLLLHKARLAWLRSQVAGVAECLAHAAHRGVVGPPAAPACNALQLLAALSML